MYRYYVSDCLLPRTANMPTNREGQRFSAARLERALCTELRDLVIDRHDADLFGAITKVSALGDRLFVEVDVTQIADDNALGAARLLRKAELIDADAKIDGGTLHLSVALPPDRRGRTKQSPDKGMVSTDMKADLAALVRTAHLRLDEITASPLGPTDHSRMKSPATDWIRQRIVIGLLAPDIQRALLTGGAAAHVTPAWMLSQDWPIDWEAQRAMFGGRREAGYRLPRCPTASCRMDDDFRNLIVSLCTQVGMIMEDTNDLALTVRGVTDEELAERVDEIDRAIRRMQALVSAARALHSRP